MPTSTEKTSPNIREVANAAGVSVATVSRYLTSPEKVAKKSAGKVEQAINKLNYKPNMLGRNLLKSRTYSILVMVPNIANPFFSRVIKGIEDIAQQKGYAVLLGDTRYSTEREAEYFRRVETKQTDGVIQLSTNIPDTLLSDPNIPVVNACECLDDVPCPIVQIDNEGASRTLVEYLLSLGHTRIGCVLGSNDTSDANPLIRDRINGYKHALSAEGIELDESLITTGDFSMRSGLNAASYYAQLKEKPSAIYCMNDEMAIGLVQGLKKAGIRVPEDISVAGFDDIEFAKYCDPPLTTISQPAEDLGRTAMHVLFELLEGNSQVQMKQVLGTDFILRKSTARFKG